MFVLMSAGQYRAAPCCTEWTRWDVSSSAARRCQSWRSHQGESNAFASRCSGRTFGRCAVLGLNWCWPACHRHGYCKTLNLSLLLITDHTRRLVYFAEQLVVVVLSPLILMSYVRLSWRHSVVECMSYRNIQGIHWQCLPV